LPLPGFGKVWSMALIAIACPSCDHGGAVGAETLPRSLQCIACGQAHRFERILPVLTKTGQMTPELRTRGQRIVALMRSRPPREGSGRLQTRDLHELEALSPICVRPNLIVVCLSKRQRTRLRDETYERHQRRTQKTATMRRYSKKSPGCLGGRKTGARRSRL